MSMILFKQTFKGIELNLSLHEWSMVTDIPYHTVYGRHRAWTAGTFPRKDILYQGKLDSNNRPILPKDIQSTVGVQSSMNWLYESERPVTIYLKQRCLGISPGHIGGEL